MVDSGRMPPGARGIGTLSVGELAGLWAVLVIGLVLRTVGIGWGLPPATPEVAASGFRGSYAPGEGGILDIVADTEPVPNNGEVRFHLYRFGMLHHGLTLLGLEAARQLNFFDGAWRDAYRRMEPGGFERTYILGRLISGLADLATVFIVFLLGREAAGGLAGLCSAALVATAPGHVLLANQISVEPTGTALLMLTALLGVRLAKAPAPRLAPWMGLSAGLAIAANNWIAPISLAICGAALWPHRKNSLTWMLTAGALFGAELITEILRVSYFEVGYLDGGTAAREWASPTKIAESILQLARFSIGFPAALAGAWGVWSLRRADAATGRLIFLGLAAGVFAFVLQGGSHMRQHLPLLPLFAIGAGYVLSTLGRAAQWPLGALIVGFAFAASLAQIQFMLSPHPANLVLAVVQNSAAPGETISRVTEDIPPIDSRIHPPGPNPLTGNLAAEAPNWVVITDLATTQIPEANRDFLARRYNTIAIFRPERIFGWATLGENGAPPDWKYTHPTITLHRLKQ